MYKNWSLFGSEGLAKIQKLIQFQAKKLMFENILKKQSQMFNLVQQQSEASKIEEGFGTTEGRVTVFSVSVPFAPDTKSGHSY